MALHFDLDRRSTAERIAVGLREAIFRGDLPPGAPLREGPIGASAGVSRTSVREALLTLTNEGLATHTAFHGVRVRELGEDDVADIFRGRLPLELAGVAAATAGGAAPGGNLLDVVDAFDAAVDRQDWHEAFAQDIRLHAEIVSALGSERLADWFEGLMRELRLGYLMFGGLQTESSPVDRREHREIAELIAAGERDECERVIRAHLSRSEELLLDLMGARRDRESAAGES